MFYVATARRRAHLTTTMSDVLHGKVAIVTGGTRGIGRAIALRLQAEGAAVAICGTSAATVEKAAAELSAAARPFVAEVADLRKLNDVRRLFKTVDERLGTVDFLINNAGVGIYKPVLDLAPEEWHRMIDLNLSGVFYCSSEALRRMVGRGGYIVNISSLAGKNAFAGGAAYNASKFGLNGFSEAMMMDHRYDGVRVSYVMPGSVATDFGSSGPAAWKIAPEDIAEVVMTLLRMPERTLISRVEIRPSKPKK
jgi:NAD(P)-dependent dehydrogenase (short-subunit alcohol dehydrogenase family)